MLISPFGAITFDIVETEVDLRSTRMSRSACNPPHV